MACPDRNKDKKIIAEIERRKQLQQTSEEIASEYNYSIYDDISLQDLLLQLDVLNVQNIQRSENGWLVITKNNKSL